MNQTKKSTAITYRISLFDPAAHIFEVLLELKSVSAAAASDGLHLTLPAWIPGSYMIREFARHIVAIDASCDGRPLSLKKLDKHSWQTAPCTGSVGIRYRVYAWDLSVRTAHFDDSHAFFNGSSVFLRIPELAAEPCRVEIQEPLHLPEGSMLRNARVATSLPRDGARRWGFGVYRASRYDELIDHPVEIGVFSLYSFKACGVPHHMVISGKHDCDGKRLIADVKPICEAQIRLFEPRSAQAPFAEYLFLTQAVGDGYGGLEHSASTALICARNDLPFVGMTRTTDGYRRFLGLVSHEYFHSWHVKRIKPAAFAPYDLYRENYTRLLWIFEGFTSYYDDLMLVRSGVTTAQDYLSALGNTISSVLRAPGRLNQSVAESSFEAWTKYYRQDEQSPNSIISYYTKGAMVALAIDLTLRERTGGKRSLDDVMRQLWANFGRDFENRQTGLGEEDFAGLLERATGIKMAAELRRWSQGTRDLELANLLKPMGVVWAQVAADSNAWLGARLVNRNGDLSIATVFTGSPAHQAGLAAGDVLLAIDGIRIDDSSLKAQLARRKPGARARLHVFRRDELREYSLRFTAAPATEVKLTLETTLAANRKSLLLGWLGKQALNKRLPS